MSEITLSLEHPSLGCGEIIARYDLSEIQEKAYQQGREDVEKELNTIHEAECNKIRADAIDECIQAIEDTKSLFDNSTKWTMAEKDKLQNKLRKLKEKAE